MSSTSSSSSATMGAARFLHLLFRRVLPVARTEIQRWTRAAADIPDPELRQQALSSLAHKRFHADGGSVYAAFRPAALAPLTQAIIALQTISDYLDNLCDRTGCFDETDFWLLHQALRDAVRPGAPLHDYYRLRHTRGDGGYLAGLVRTCQDTVRTLPGYASAYPYIHWMIERYCELQTYKHIHPADRRARLEAWWRRYDAMFPELYGWEFAAATGSTLGVFALLAAAAEGLSENSAQTLFERYFPWLCGLHILLDYLIDLEEDAEEGDFNFVRCYATPHIAERRLTQFAARSWWTVGDLPDAALHRYIVQGLLAMYLSDPKASSTPLAKSVRRLLWSAGGHTLVFYAACRVYRRIR